MRRRLTLGGATFGMPKLCRAIVFVFVCFLSALACAQDLAPRAYIITPMHSNAVTLTYSFYSGEILFDGAVPITGATSKVSVSVFSLTHSLRLFGRSANFSASLPYSVGDYQGTVVGLKASAHRSGM